MLPERLPRTLIVSPNALHRRFGGGVTMSRLFGRWRAEDIALIHADVIDPDMTICGRAYRLNGAYPGGRSFGRQARRLAAYARADADTALGWARLRPSLRQWITDFAPEVIFAQPCSLALTRVCREIAATTGAPLVLHVSDDWVADWPASVVGRQVFPITQSLAKQARREFGVLVEDARARLCISEAMAEAYSRRYGRSFTPVYNAVDVSAWPQQPLRPRTAERPFRLLYSGSIYPYTQLQSLIDVADAVAGINERRPTPVVTLDVCTDESYFKYRGRIERDGCVSMTPAVPLDALAGKLATADVLVLPVNFDRHSLSFIRYSLPGKLAEYLLSQRPLLVYGPADAAPVQLAREHGFGVVVERRNVAALSGSILAMMDDHPALAEMAARGVALARRDFDLAAMQARFESIMAEAAGLARLKGDRAA